MPTREPSRRCRSCGRTFHPQRKTQVFCRPVCRHESRRRRRNDQRFYAGKQRESGAKPITCAACGQEMAFPPRRSTRRYCSNKCRQWAHRQRQPSAAQIRERFDRELERLQHRLDSAHRVERVRAWVREPK